MFGKRGGDTVDLIDDREATAALLAHPLEWRTRAVEHIEIDGESSCRRRRSLQCAPLQELLPGAARRAKFAMLALNVAPVPRGPLFEFDVTGPFGAAYLLPRQEIALRQALFIRDLAESAGFPVSDQCVDFLVAMFGMPRTPDREAKEQSNFEIGEYLSDGLNGAGVSHYDNWIGASREVAQVIDRKLDRDSPRSPTRLPVLAIPEYVGATEATPPSVDAVIREYSHLIQSADAASVSGKPGAVDELLASVADYGDYYDLIVATKVPLREPFVMSYSERRNLSLSFWSGAGSQDLVIADAVSNHVALEVADPSVELGRRVEAVQPGTGAVTYGAFTGRSTRQFWSMYAHGSDRDYRITLKFRVRPLSRLQGVPYVLSVMLVLLAFAMWNERIRELNELALIAGPAALAASLLIAREQTSVASRVRLASSGVVAAALLFLLGTAVALYLCWSPASLIDSIRG
ncbi:hypothetical protein [Cellulomonas sp.]|uniref:hypothetical protein n=1 Tax=Cellulomonas sp. TaxID=40001 RepID=UPI002D2BC5EC|nr:hypothetical protein [Cellulomonas sp.]HYQ76401.1 hypothetical protein [Cellulomonas sp.]